MIQPTLSQACSVSFLEDPSINKKHETGTRKHITPAISGFDNPLVWWGVRTHTFLQQHWHDRVPSVAYLPDVPVRSKADVNKYVEFLIRWACKCFVRFRVIVNFSSSQGCERRNLGPIELGDLTADYTFTTSTPANTTATFAVLEIRAPGALDCFSLTESPSYNARRSDKGLDKHARAFSFQFNCPLVMFYDGVRLVSFFFTNPTDTITAPPQFWVAEHEDDIRSDVEVAYRIRYMMMSSLCHARDAKLREWHQQH